MDNLLAFSINIGNITSLGDCVSVTINNAFSYKSSTNWSSLSESYMNGYLQFLSQTMLNDKMKKNLEKIREFLNWAKLKKYPVNEDFFLYKPKLPSTDKAVRYLTIDEVSSLISLDLSANRSLEETRDYFIFQCFTALRYSDVSAAFLFGMSAQNRAYSVCS
mgnify:CR=1 FL=1